MTRLPAPETVLEAIREVAADVIEPRHGTLRHDEIEEKAAGEIVTAVDREAEQELARRLTQLYPVPIVGEEAAAADVSVMDLVAAEELWLIDPLDGTSNFADGSPDYAVMAALVQRGRTVQSWIWRPADRAGYVAEHNAGAFRNGERLRRAPAPSQASSLRGVVKTRFLPPDVRTAFESNRERFGSIEPGRFCAGVDYPRVVEGELDFVVYWRTLPWDHAPGSLLIREAGGAANRRDGRPYEPSQTGDGLVVAADETTYRTVAGALAGP